MRAGSKLSWPLAARHSNHRPLCGEITTDTLPQLFTQSAAGELMVHITLYLIHNPRRDWVEMRGYQMSWAQSSCIMFCSVLVALPRSHHSDNLVAMMRNIPTGSEWPRNSAHKYRLSGIQRLGAVFHKVRVREVPRANLHL